MDASASRLSLPATVESITAFCEFVREGAVAAGIAGSEIGKLDLALEEILINIARYAYAPLSGVTEVRYMPEGPGRLKVEIADCGRAFNPLDVDPPDFSRGLADRPIGGLGLFLIKGLVEFIAYRREDDRNILSFVFPAAGE